MSCFKIGDYEFGIGKVNFKVVDNKMMLDIYGDDAIFTQLSAGDDSEWSWALEAPKAYFWGIPLLEKKLVIELNEELMDTCDFALYLMEHNDLFGVLTMNDKNIEISGEVDIMGEIYPLKIVAEIP